MTSGHHNNLAFSCFCTIAFPVSKLKLETCPLPKTMGSLTLPALLENVIFTAKNFDILLVI